ncbi:terminase [Tardibacter chloracetimidivorans]|uniref:Terminase n=2 Tax=Tardibacter chloracetimidivorans TaxID=1921510 RepID=A0A1L3ZVM2_9SPHN|nr:terminase [Tardibacter chloracetimidivorans]
MRQVTPEQWAAMTPAQRRELVALVSRFERPWYPLKGPQTMAYESKADIIGFGGAAGGGKTDLACGKSITHHQKIMALRRVGTELTGILDRFTELFGNRDGYNGKDNIWRTRRFDGKPLQIEFGAVPILGDEKKFQGRPHDLLIFDEAANFLEIQVRFLLGWLRSVDPTQKCQALLTFNPPTSAEGRWIISFFAPWLDKKFPNPALPGELRYAAMVPDAQGGSKDVWVDGPEPFVLVDGEPCYDFDPADYAPTEIITPKSRTFIPSRITDNPHLFGTGYMSTLQALPEPLRSQMLNGDFAAGMEDDPWQVIPTAWVEAAMARWKEHAVKPPMDSLGVDVARGGKDNTTIARLHGNWFDKTLLHPGTQTPDGPAVAGLVIASMRDQAPIHIDVIGVGASPYDFLISAHQQVIGVNVSETARGTDKSGRLSFPNMRSELWWKFREWLDPANNTGAALPNEPELLAELTAPKWSLQGPKIVVESREQIIARIGRSPDRASAYILALVRTPKLPKELRPHSSKPKDYDPYA